MEPDRLFSSLGAFLSRQDSELASLARLQLRMLATILRHQRKITPRDPAGAECDAFINVLLGCLRRSNAFTEIHSDVPVEIIPPVLKEIEEPETAATPCSPSLVVEPGLSLWELIKRDSRLGPTLPEQPSGEADDGAVWFDVQLLLLRGAGARSKIFQDVLKSYAEKLGAEVVEPGQEDLLLSSFPHGTVFPALGGKIIARGMKSDLASPLDERIQDLLPPSASEDLLALAKIGSDCLRLIDADRTLHHALAAVHEFDVVPLDAQQRSRWERALLDRFSSVVGSRNEVDQFLARVNFDEAIHSLEPLANADSWWGSLKKLARDNLFEAVQKLRAAGSDVAATILAGAYAAVSNRSRQNLGVVGDAPPGDVQICLKVYARVGGNVFPGRVLYRRY